MNRTARKLVTLMVTVACLLVAGAPLIHADDGPGDAQNTDASQIQRLSSEELHTLVAPIALYPDALLAQILPASAFPIQIVEAYRHIQNNGSPDNPPAGTNWDPSVISLMHYPTALKKLNDDPTWTDQLGVAATYQLSDVMRAIQQVRSEAQAVGNLVSNDKQVVQADQGNIEIMPASDNTMYVPEYDPVSVCDTRLDNPYVWGQPYGYGLWLGNRWDWAGNRLWYGDSWRDNRWYRGTPTYWRAPYRAIPSWYRRDGYRRNGPAVPYRNGYTGGLNRFDRVHPIASSRLRTPGVSGTVRPFVQTAPIRNAFAEDALNRRNQTLLEANRGRLSRERTAVAHTPAVRESIVRQPVVRESVVREPVRAHVEAVRPHAVERPSFHQEMGRATDRGTANRESSRGSSSRASAAGGGNRGGGGGGSHGGKR